VIGGMATIVDIARGDPLGPDLVPDELVVLAVMVVAFWTLIAAILTALWFALRRQREGRHRED
jgi:hypothetical protein